MKQISCKVYRESSPVEELLLQDFVNLEGKPCQFIQNDLYLLFNQERLEAIGKDTMIEYLNSLVPGNDGLSELRAKCSDEQLLSLIKSRHIQSRSELLLWSKFLNNSAGELVKSINEAESVKSSETISFKDNESVES